MPVVHAAIVYDCPTSGELYVLIVNIALHFKDLSVNLIHPFIMRIAGLVVDKYLQTILYMLHNMMLGYHGCVSWRICCQVRMCRSRLLLIRAYGIPTAPPMQTRKLQWRTIRATWRTRPLSPVSLHSLSEKMDSCHKTYRLFGWMVCYELTRKTELNIGLASGCYTAITCSTFSSLVTLIR